MLNPDLLLPVLANGITTGAIYAIVALGLTLIYGVLHIINFAHGSLLMLAMYGVFFLHDRLSVDPYAAIVVMVPAMFALGYLLQRGVIGKSSHGKDENILLITLGLAIIIENLALFLWRSDTRIIDTPYTFALIEIGPVVLSTPKFIALLAAAVVAGGFGALMRYSDLGRAIRAVAKEKTGARLVGIDVEHVYAMSFGLGLACLGAAACLLLPSFYVSPQVGNAFLLIAFTVVVLGGMGSFFGAFAGGILIGIVESVSGFYFGENIGQITIFIVFIFILLFRPQGLFARTI